MFTVLFHRLGPYHHARLKSLCGRGEFAAIEFSKVDKTYAWDQVCKQNGYPVITLFADSDVDILPITQVMPAMERALERFPVKAVAIPGWSSPSSLAALDWCCRKNIPAILMVESTAHDEPRTWWKEWIKSRVVRLFSSAIVGGRAHTEYVRALGFSPQNILVGYDVVDNNYFSLAASRARANSAALRRQHGLPDKYFLASSRFIKKKNLSRLLDAYAAYVLRAGSASWDLVLLGDGELKSSVMEQAVRLGLIDRILFPGFKQYDELPVYYGLASAFIQASTSEQWGLVVNEAMAAGLPVLVSKRCGCAPDLVENAVNGYTFDPYDVEEMSDLMFQIADCNTDLTSMGQASQKIIALWSPETFATGMMKAVAASLAAPPPRVGWFDRAVLWMLMRR